MITRATVVATVMAIVIGTGACSAVDRATVPTPSENPYASLQFGTHVLTMGTMAPYNSIQLAVTAYRSDGSVVSHGGAPRYVVSDTSLHVSETGVLTASTITNSSYVIVSMQDTAQQITHADTLAVIVTDTAPTTPLQTLSLRPAPGVPPSTPVYIQQTPWAVYRPNLRITGADGSDLTELVPVRFSSSDSMVAAVDRDSGVVTGIKPGHVVITATTTFYGITKRDTVGVTITTPMFVEITSLERLNPDGSGSHIRFFSPGTVTVGVGGTVLFAPHYSEYDLTTFDVQFDDPSAALASDISPDITFVAPGSGNIPARVIPKIPNILGCFDADFLSICQSTRMFNRAGTYHYHSATYGTTGTIIVK